MRHQKLDWFFWMIRVVAIMQSQLAPVLFRYSQGWNSEATTDKQKNVLNCFYGGVRRRLQLPLMLTLSFLCSKRFLFLVWKNWQRSQSSHLNRTKILGSNKEEDEPLKESEIKDCAHHPELHLKTNEALHGDNDNDEQSERDAEDVAQAMNEHRRNLQEADMPIKVEQKEPGKRTTN